MNAPTTTPTADAQGAAAEADVVARLRAGDEEAFAALVEAHHGAMLTIALTYVRAHAVAEEVVQDTWTAVLTGIDRFRSRSSLRTWITRILVNTAITRGGREARMLPLSSLDSADASAAVDPGRFWPAGHERAGQWQAPPGDWSSMPEDRLLARETLEIVKRAIEVLPALQRRVITMRDVAGFSAQEVCDTLDLSAGNQRVLLHRARSQVRAALERYLDG